MKERPGIPQPPETFRVDAEGRVIEEPIAPPIDELAARRIAEKDENNSEMRALYARPNKEQIRAYKTVTRRKAKEH